MDTNQCIEIYERDWAAYLRSDILAPESVLLGRLKTRWGSTRMLDLGMGTGRTTWVFSPLVQEYVGLELAPKMVQECRRLFGENENRRFVVGDAANLSSFHSGSFDLILFSYNGIDHLSGKTRKDALAEAFRVLKPGGDFFFSSHNINVFPHSPWKAWTPGRNPLRWPRSVVHLAKEFSFFSRVNELALSSKAQELGWAVLPDCAHGYSLQLCYIHPERQKADLEAAGFQLLDVLDFQGKPLADLSKPGKDWTYHYHAVKPSTQLST